MPATPMLRARTAALVTFTVVLVAVISALVSLYVRHRQTLADEASLHRNPSYQYGIQQNVKQVEMRYVQGVARTPEAQCRVAVAKPPTNITPYSAEKAYRGCIDKDRALNK